MPNLLLTSYKLHDAVHAKASPELSEWLDRHAKKWKVQVKWGLPDEDTGHLTELATVLHAMLPQAKGKRVNAIERLIGEIETVLGTKRPTAAEVVAKLAEPGPKPGPEPEPKLELDPPAAIPAAIPPAPVEPEAQVEVERVEPETQKAPETSSEPVSEPEPAMAAQITCPAGPVALRRLEPETRIDIPPPEARAKNMLGDLFRRIQAGA